MVGSRLRKSAHLGRLRTDEVVRAVLIANITQSKVVGRVLQSGMFNIGFLFDPSGSKDASGLTLRGSETTTLLLGAALTGSFWV